MSAQVYQASCLCEGIKYSVQGEPENIMVCYCTDCSKNAGGPYQMVAKFDKSNVKIHEGEDLVGTWVVKKTISGSDKQKKFCKRCGCTLWTVPMHQGGNKYIVRTSLIDGGLEHFKPRMEYCTKTRLKSLKPFEGTQQFETMPGH